MKESSNKMKKFLSFYKSLSYVQIPENLNTIYDKEQKIESVQTVQNHYEEQQRVSFAEETCEYICLCIVEKIIVF